MNADSVLRRCINVVWQRARKIRDDWGGTALHDKANVVLAGIGLCVLFTYTFYTARMYCANKKAADAAMIAANTAAATLTSAQEQFKIDHRPILWLTNQNYAPKLNRPSKQILWEFHLANYGKTPIQSIRYNKYMKVGDKDFTITYGAKGPSVGPPLPPGSIDYYDDVISEPHITEAEFKRLLGISNSLSIKIVFDYTDAYGGEYQTGVCLTRLNTGAVGYCKEGNYIK